MALEEGDAEVAERDLREAQRAIEAAGKRTYLPEEVFLRRLPRSAAAKVFKGGVGEGNSRDKGSD